MGEKAPLCPPDYGPDYDFVKETDGTYRLLIANPISFVLHS